MKTKEYQIIMRGSLYQKIVDISYRENISDIQLKDSILSHIRANLIKVNSSGELSLDRMEHLQKETKNVVESKNNFSGRHDWIYEDEVRFNVLIPDGLYDESKNILENFSVLLVDK